MRLGLHALTACTRGTAAIEFAIVSVVFITLCVGTIDFGRTMYVKNQLAFLADQAMRQVILNPNISDATLEADLEARFTAGDPESLTVDIATAAVGSNTYRVLTIGYPITLFVPNIMSETLNLSVVRRVPTF